MTRTIFCMICMFIVASPSFSVQAEEVNLTKSFGIGLQGATPEFGGVSFRYNGLSPIYFQTVGRFVLRDEWSDHMIGGGVSYAIFEHQSRWSIARLFFTLEGAWQYSKEQEEKYIGSGDEWRYRDSVVTKLVAGLAFGGELVFSLGGIPLGLNVEVGQGFARETEASESRGLAGVYVGMGIHAYF